MRYLVRALVAALALLRAATLDAQRDVVGEFTGAAGTRRYVVHVPAGADGARRPLVLVLHGCTQDARQIALGTGFSAGADSLGFLVLYPEQPTSVPARCWQWFDPAHQSRGGGEPALLADLTRSVSRQFGADTSRVFVAGISAGAAMAVNLLAAYPELFAAGAAHSGIAYRAAAGVMPAVAVMKSGVPGGAVPELPAMNLPRLLVLHGTRDSVVAPINGDQLTRQWVHAIEKSRGHSLESRESVVRLGGRDADVRTFVDGKSVAVESWLVHELGHAWSGGSLTGSYTDAAGPSATALILRFFGLGQ
jgi:poly(hydroxyalkanoate) depolymerase family esterase